jgi:putative endonuclease
MKDYVVYVLWSRRLKKRYIGCTSDIENRVREHNAGRQRFTKGGIPWLLIYSEQVQNLNEARKREVYLKGRSGRQFLDNLYDMERCESG